MGTPEEISPITETARARFNYLRDQYGFDPLPLSNDFSTAESRRILPLIAAELDAWERRRLKILRTRELATQIGELPGYLCGRIDNRADQIFVWVTKGDLEAAKRIAAQTESLTVEESVVALADRPEFRSRLETDFGLAPRSFQVNANPEGWIVVLEENSAEAAALAEAAELIAAYPDVSSVRTEPIMVVTPLVPSQVMRSDGWAPRPS